MSTKNESQEANPLQVVYVVAVYGNIVGVYADPHDAFTVQMEQISKNKPASMSPFSVIYPKNL